MHYRTRVYPKNIESPFSPDEMFFSVTDLKGIILSGNKVFVRTSKFTKYELIGLLQNIIKHLDMPRIIFKLLWDYIKNVKPIVAYIATMLPVKYEKGKPVKYLSVRINPITECFSLVGKYQKTLKN